MSRAAFRQASTEEGLVALGESRATTTEYQFQLTGAEEEQSI